ncbi:MAG: ATP-binding cassette domain-containing protein [Deltaproteobacteria bacterium]|nr:ATP-binding cassette domain-containing protein [Deltaproteobacteria bacterium]
MNADAVVAIANLRHIYGPRVAIDDVSLSIDSSEIFALLGPNGGGKSTLFKILSTLITATSGEVHIFGEDVRRNPYGIRSRLGVVFQSPSLDPKLTVTENLLCHGHLYGMSGGSLRERVEVLLHRLALTDRVYDMVGTLSGGLQRRVELAKALLHQPALLLLDEPSTGLDPGARRDFNDYLHLLREQNGTTIMLTTHLMDEAERCDCVAILHQGKLVALDSPENLKAQVGGDIVAIRTQNAAALREKLAQRFSCDPLVVDGTLRVERSQGHEFVREIFAAFPGEIQSITFGRPTLEDVFVHQTGQRFWDDEQQTEQVA